jgi:mannose-6-phosphate isomerase-like protein (cupin superfamily)
MAVPDKIVVADKLARIERAWDPKVIAELNGQEVKLARLKGEFDWHLHEREDELFYVLGGRFRMEFRARAASSTAPSPTRRRR